jgi:hypothetical protein
MKAHARKHTHTRNAHITTHACAPAPHAALRPPSRLYRRRHRHHATPAACALSTAIATHNNSNISLCPTYWESNILQVHHARLVHAHAHRHTPRVNFGGATRSPRSRSSSCRHDAAAAITSARAAAAPRMPAAICADFSMFIATMPRTVSIVGSAAVSSTDSALRAKLHVKQRE